MRAAIRSKTKPAREAAAAGEPSRRPTVILFGDSHSQAVQKAIQKRLGKGLPSPLIAHRVTKEKNGRTIGDISFDQFLGKIGKLGPDDLVVSMIGGNQHAVFSTIQHPQRFDFFFPGEPAVAGGVEIIPFQVMQDLFLSGLRRGDGQMLKTVREATRARVVHVLPPPPKGDNDFIIAHHETTFAERGIAELGVSDPALRRKFWLLQARILIKLCRRMGVEVLMPYSRTQEQGFLRPQFYGKDATHANWRYGERIIRQLEQRYLGRAG